MNNRFLIKVQCFLIVFLIIFVNGVQVFAALEPPELNAASAILVESKRGQILFEKDSRKRLHIASANKLMTALLALEKAGAKLDTQVTISKNVTEVEGLKMNLEVGAKYSVEDLVYTIILTSGNDSAIALAEYVGGDVKTFVDMMNKKAHELKLKDTSFTNPTGLYDEAQYTTAYDLALLLRYALSNPAFDRIFSTEAKLWTNQNKVEIITNSNSLFWRYDGIDGGKTGYNDLERQTAITTATRNNMRIISIVLDSPEESVYEDSIKLLDYGFGNFKTGVLVKKEQIIETMYVEGKAIDLISPIDVYYTYPVGEYYIKDIDIKIKEDIELPVLKTRVVGAVKYILKDGTEINVDLYPAVNVYSSVDMFSSFVKSMIEYKEITILLFILIWIELFLIILKLLRVIKKVILKLVSKVKS
ncbi:MAG TPA: D-alanyl-D-alanine carboxypeptidase family protein [Acetivibrio clariflavus]|nr:D-alanyl-D-alanine carboxypeptidase family protein [Acetivibrio clariflavus]